MRLFDQIDDFNLSKLSSLLNNLLPLDWFDHSINPIEDILPIILNQDIDGVKMILDTPPEANIKVINTPNGKIIMGSIKKKHSSYMADDDMVIPSMVRSKMSEEGTPFAYGNKFPVGDPFQALMSLLYAMGQKDTIGKDTFDNTVKPRIADTLGDDTVNKIIEIANKLEDGSEEVVDENLKKKITITVDNFSDAALENQKDESKVDITSDTTEEDNKDMVMKEASLKYLLTSNNYRVKKYNSLLKKAGKVQTSIYKLADMLEPFHYLERMDNFINLLKNAMLTDHKFTIASSDIQLALLEKLSTIFKDKDNNGEDFIKDLIYNTDIPNETGEIIYIDATLSNYNPDTKEYTKETIQAPIDVEKMNNLSYPEAEKALTAAVADEIFNESKTEVNLDKFKMFIEGIQKIAEDGGDSQEIADRIVEPILLMFSPDTEVMENIGVPSEEITKEEIMTNDDEILAENNM